MTYHKDWPTDGRTSKAHLNAWLTTLRRLVPGVGYLWLLEFQKRNAPHYHVFLTIPPDEETRLKLAEAWCRITSPDDPQALRFHQDQRNWILWDMGSGSYLCKYLDKEAQKAVPVGYHGFGRFWGNSRGLEAAPVQIPLDDLDDAAAVDQETGEIYGGASTVIRWLGRLAEKQTRGIPGSAAAPRTAPIPCSTVPELISRSSAISTACTRDRKSLQNSNFHSQLLGVVKG